MKRSKYIKMEKRTRNFFKKANIVVRDDENIEVADFGKGDVEK